jgi:hypothetical protein
MKTLTKAQRHVTFKKVQKKLHEKYEKDSNLVNYQYLCYEVAKTKKFEVDTDKQIEFAKSMTELELFKPTPNYEEGEPWFSHRELGEEVENLGEVRLLALALMVEMTKPTKKRK